MASIDHGPHPLLWQKRDSRNADGKLEKGGSENCWKLEEVKQSIYVISEGHHMISEYRGDIDEDIVNVIGH